MINKKSGVFIFGIIFVMVFLNIISASICLEETDGGHNIYVDGEISFTDDDGITTSYSDECVSYDVLREYTCDDDLGAEYIDVECPLYSTCTDGICETQVCSSPSSTCSEWQYCAEVIDRNDLRNNPDGLVYKCVFGEITDYCTGIGSNPGVLGWNCAQYATQSDCEICANCGGENYCKWQNNACTPYSCDVIYSGRLACEVGVTCTAYQSGIHGCTRDPDDCQWIIGCSETDGGRDYGVRGETRGCLDMFYDCITPEERTDFCADDNTIYEYYCEAGEVSYNLVGEFHDCATGEVCVEGACVFECNDDGDCASNEHCDLQQGCVLSCTAGSCSSGEYCNSGTGVCESCSETIVESCTGTNTENCGSINNIPDLSQREIACNSAFPCTFSGSSCVQKICSEIPLAQCNSANGCYISETCESGGVPSTAIVYWADGEGGEINSLELQTQTDGSFNGNVVYMIIEDSGLPDGSATFEIFEDDALGDDEIRVGSNAITGSVSGGIATASFTITQSDVENAGWNWDGNSYSYGTEGSTLGFYFRVNDNNDLESSVLDVTEGQDLCRPDIVSCSDYNEGNFGSGAQAYCENNNDGGGQCGVENEQCEIGDFNGCWWDEESESCNPKCGVPSVPDVHAECVNNVCEIVDGSGVSDCSIIGASCDDYCNENECHPACVDGMCFMEAGSGTNECSSNAGCSLPDAHTECQSEMCVEVSGEGVSECAIVGASCSLPLESYASCVDGMCMLAEGVGIDGCSGNSGCLMEEISQIGTCYYSEDSSGDDCEDGYLTYSWNAIWEWAPGNEIIQYDPKERHLNCVPGDGVQQCPAQIQLPFFNFYNLIATLIAVGLIYIVIHYYREGKKCKKKKNSKK